MNIKRTAIISAVVLVLVLVLGKFVGCSPRAWVAPGVDSAISMRVQSGEYAKQTRALERIATSLESIDAKVK